MTKKELKEKAQEAFSSHPSVNAFFLTSDGFAYGSLSGASGHASTLQNNAIYIFNQSDMDNPTLVGGFDRDNQEDIDQSTSENEGHEGKKTTLAPIEERIMAINSAADIEQLDALLSNEKAKTALAAGEIRRTQILIQQAQTVEELDELAKGLEDEALLLAITDRKSQINNN